MNKAATYALVVLFGTIVVTGMASWGMLSSLPANASTVVPGQIRDSFDANNNGYPDEGIAVAGKYKSLYAYDASGDYYWDLGDGRVIKTEELANLDQASLTECVYQVQYKGMFNDTPYLDSGWIKNEINCSGIEKGTFNSTIVHMTDPRYRGDEDNAIWGDWEYHVNTESGVGNIANLARPEKWVGRAR